MTTGEREQEQEYLNVMEAVKSHCGKYLSEMSDLLDKNRIKISYFTVQLPRVMSAQLQAEFKEKIEPIKNNLETSIRFKNSKLEDIRQQGEKLDDLILKFKIAT